LLGHRPELLVDQWEQLRCGVVAVAERPIRVLRVTVWNARHGQIPFADRRQQHGTAADSSFRAEILELCGAPGLISRRVIRPRSTPEPPRRHRPGSIARHRDHGESLAASSDPLQGRPSDALHSSHTRTDEPDVPADSTTETYVAARAEIDTWRWSGVPFLLRHGKRLARKFTEVQFRSAPIQLFNRPEGIDDDAFRRALRDGTL
jgi:hypothetical protein